MKKAIISLLLILAFINSVSALCNSPPSIPVEYSGNILNNEGEIIDHDYEITAYLNDYGNIGVVSGGNYNLSISSCSGSSSGEISFFINGVEANEHPEYHGLDDFGKSYLFNLTFNPEPPTNSSCGNGEKDLGEVCDGNDFGDLACSNYGFNSGELRCSDSCINIYISACYTNSQGNTGGGGSDGGSSGSSGGGGATYLTPENSGDNPDANTTNLNAENSDNNAWSPLTGNTISNFAKSGAGIGILIIFIILVGISVILIRRRK